MMNKIISKWLPCAALALWGGVMIYFYADHKLVNYLVPTFQRFTLAAGIVLLLLAACFAFLPVSLGDCAEDDLREKSFGRKSLGKIFSFLVLLVPIGAAAMFSSQSYAITTVKKQVMVTDTRGLGTQQKTKTDAYVEPPLPTKDGSQPDASANAQSSPQTPSDSDGIPRSKEGNIIVQVVDLLYAAQDPSLRGDFKDQNIEMIGQLMPDTMNNGSGKRFKLVRMFMVCCAADARPVSVLIESDTKPQGAEMSWIKVVGKVEFPIENGRPVAVVKAAKVLSVDPPEETMLY